MFNPGRVYSHVCGEEHEAFTVAISTCHIYLCQMMESWANLCALHFLLPWLLSVVSVSSLASAWVSLSLSLCQNMGHS